ncbi:putative membrane protein YphA (DoxX/SURF4 family) [Rhizomicrobium palustre]|uniref:Putative membrane protein YphA (DoxX/SURF4 family) n=1 Tax=Rhizomicrobium palustre TaxID=189966 RepID=A0A846MTM2_9PROT|nr:DoxX family protein [Rhizomicrobium palustre]NIK86784.1 putative membrane protein YphA (DoxX/SURF4 family) [Rhizomicrobium palustre]
MQSWTERDPGWVDAILEWRWTWLLARVGLTSAYFIGGVNKALDFPAAVAEQAHFGMQPAVLWAGVAVVCELVAPVLIVWGRFVWLAAGALGVLTFIASLLANDFWNKTGEAHFMALNSFFEHIGLIAGLVMAALIAEHAKRQR